MSSINTELQNSFTVCQSNNCSAFDLTDTTGLYNSVTNPTGFNTPNPVLGDLTSATLIITYPDGTDSGSLDVITLSSGNFPNLGDIPMEITSASLGLGTKFTDGVYEFELTYEGSTVGIGDWSTTCTLTILFACQTKCCLDFLFSNIEAEDCQECQNNTLNRVIKADAYLQGAMKAACCSKRRRAAKLLAQAGFLCNLTTCNNC